MNKMEALLSGPSGKEILMHCGDCFNRTFTYKKATASAEDIKLFNDIRNCPETFLFLKNPVYYSDAETSKWLSSGVIRLIVYRNSTPVGIIRIDSIDETNRNCCIGLDIHPKCRGKGYSQPIYKDMLDWHFKHLNFECIWLEVLETNKRAIHIYKELGFKVDGVLRNRIYREGHYINYIVMSILRAEWLKGH